MKQILIAVALVLHSFGVQAQKCKPYNSYKDEFKGLTYNFYGGKLDYKKNMLEGTSTTVSVVIYTSQEYSILALKIEIFQGLNDASVNSIEMGDSSQFMLKTESGIMEFTADVVGRSKSKFADKILTTTELSVSISKEQIETLASHPILMYQVLPVNYSVIQGEVNEGNGEKIRLQFNCFKNL